MDTAQVMQSADKALAACEHVLLNPNITWDQEADQNPPPGVVRAVRMSVSTSKLAISLVYADDPAGETHTCGVCQWTENGQVCLVCLPTDFVAQAIAELRRRFAEMN